MKVVACLLLVGSVLALNIPKFVNARYHPQSGRLSCQEGVYEDGPGSKIKQVYFEGLDTDIDWVVEHTNGVPPQPGLGGNYWGTSAIRFQDGIVRDFTVSFDLSSTNLQDGRLNFVITEMSINHKHGVCGWKQ